MKKKFTNAIFLLLLTILLQTCRHEDYVVIPEHLGVTLFPDAKEAAIAFTFDDNCPSSFSTIVPMFEDYGYKATFFIIANQIGSDAHWARWRELSERGFEIGNHTFTHPNLSKINDAGQLDHEINDSFELISQKIGKAPFSFAHPNHMTNDLANSIVLQKHHASRIYPKGYFSMWGVLSSSTEGEFEDFLNNAIKKHYISVVAAHGVKDGWEPVGSQWLKSCLEVVKKNENKVAVDHFGNLAKYRFEQENTKVIAYRRIANDLVVKLESSLDTAIFNFPLTLLIDAPHMNRSQVTALGKTKILGFTSDENRTLIKLLPKSKIQIQF